MIKTWLKKLIIILLIIFSLFSALFSGVSLGTVEVEDEYLTLERAGNYVSNFSIFFYNNWSSNVNPGGKILTDYSPSASVVTESSPQPYTFSNTSFINFAYAGALSLDSSNYPISNLKSNRGVFEELALDELQDLYIANLVKQGIKEARDNNAPIDIAKLMNSGFIIPGDILYSSEGEYLLYVGATKVMYAYKPNPTDDNKGAIRYEFLEDYLVQIKRKLELQHEDEEDYEPGPYGITNIYRMTENFASTIKSSQANLMFNNKGYYDSKMTYEGLPTQGAYTGSTNASLLKFVIDGFLTIIKFLINLILYLIRMVIVGWVNIVENFIQWIVLALSGNSSQLSLVDKMGMRATSYSGRRITVESLFYNKVPITDANFFNFESAGGYNLVDEKGNKTVLYFIRENLATMYKIVRNFSIAASLFVLLYAGIRMAIATIGEKKARYMELCKDWLFGLAVVFLIHIFMYTVLYVNDNFLDVISNINVGMVKTVDGVAATESSLYDAVRTKAYTFSAVEGTVGLILYIMLVYLFIRFFFIYIKRTVAIYVLALIGPFMGVKYAYDKANGKRNGSLTKWAKDFIYNVLLQTVHCLTYSMLMIIALKISASISGAIFGIVVLRFILQADKIIMKIFGMDSNKGLFKDVITKTEPSKYIGAYTRMMMLGKALPVFKAKDTDEYSKFKQFRMRLKYTQLGDTPEDVQRKIDMHKFNELAMKHNKPLNKAKNAILEKASNTLKIHALKERLEREKQYARLGGSSSYEIKKQIYNNIQRSRALEKQRYTRPVSTIKNLVGGTYDIISGVPLILEQGGTAAALHKVVKGTKKISSEVNAKEGRMSRRVQPDGTGYGAGNLLSNAQRKAEKIDKDIKKNDGTRETLNKISDSEQEIEQAVWKLQTRARELATLKGYSEAEINDALQKELKSKIANVNRTNINAEDMRKAIGDYMYENNKTRVKSEDINGILSSVQSTLDNKYNNKKTIGNNTAVQIQVPEFNEEKELKDATAIMVEEINKLGFIDNSSNEYISQINDIEVQKQLVIIEKNLKNIYGMNQRNKVKNGKAAVEYNAIIKEIIDKFGEAKQ